jgi:hypothetical protein
VSQNAVKHLSPELRRLVQDRLDDGWPFKEITATLGVSYYLLRKHFPGRAWSHPDTIQHATNTRTARKRNAQV